MTAPLSDVDVCNLALDYLSQQDTVTSINPPATQTEATMARWYDHVRQICLREYVWNFAKKRVVLSSSTDLPPFDFQSMFPIPNDCIRILSIGGPNEYYSGDALTDGYDISDGFILTNSIPTVDSVTGLPVAATLNLRYIQDITDVTRFDSLFVNIFALRLAMKIAYKFTLKASIIQAVNEQLKIDELKAASINGQERPPIKIEYSKYMAARKGYSPYGMYAGPYTVFY